MKITKSQLKQLIKEEFKTISEIYDPKKDYGADGAYTGEWGPYTRSDLVKHGKSPWFTSHFRDQMLQRFEDRLPIPWDHVWRKIEDALQKARLYRPSPEADAFIENMLEPLRKQAGPPHMQEGIPEYWIQPENWWNLQREGRITKQQLKQIIKEEIDNLQSEGALTDWVSGVDEPVAFYVPLFEFSNLIQSGGTSVDLTLEVPHAYPKKQQLMTLSVLPAEGSEKSRGTGNTIPMVPGEPVRISQLGDYAFTLSPTAQ